MRLWNVALTTIVTVLVAMAISTVAFIVLVDTRPPLVGLTIEPINSPVLQGRRLIGRATREKVRDDCPIVSTRTASSMSGHRYVLAGQVWQGGEANKEDFIDVIYDTRELPVGIYKLDYIITYLCPWGLTFVYDDGFFFAIE